MEGITSLDERLITVFASVLISTFVSLLMFRLNLYLLDKKSVDEAAGRILLFCEYLKTLITNDSVSEVDEFLKVFVHEYGVMRKIDAPLVNDYKTLNGISLFLKSNGYADRPERKENDIQLLEDISHRYEAKFTERSLLIRMAKSKEFICSWLCK